MLCVCLRTILIVFYHSNKYYTIRAYYGMKAENVCKIVKLTSWGKNLLVKKKTTRDTGKHYQSYR